MAFSLKSVYVADLRVLKSRLARYEAGEIAHIENVLRSEFRERSHRRLRRTDDFTSVETEREEENTRDLQSTERFELENELNRTASENESLEAGVSASASGPGFTVTSRLGYSRMGSAEESEQSAQRSIKELIDKSIARIKERVREVRESRTIVETEENNVHRFNNSTDSNISGIYRWVDKYYRMQEKTYGKRLFYEFVIPEPAVFYLMARAHAEQSSENVGSAPEKPVDPLVGTPLTPDMIYAGNYRYFSGLYGAIPVPTLPPSETIVTKSISREFTGDADQSWSFSDSIAIPAGYSAVDGFAVLTAHIKVGNYDHPEYSRVLSSTFDNNNTERFGEIVVGSGADQSHIVIPSSEDTQRIDFTCSSETGQVEISGSGSSRSVFHPLPEIGSPAWILGFSLNVEVLCRRQWHIYQKWQTETFNAIWNAYERELLAYRDRLAAATISGQLTFGSENPVLNRLVERTELKRGCLESLGRDFENMDWIEQDTEAEVPDNFPRIRRPPAGFPDASFWLDWITSLEDAFDWEHMSYRFYPYYYGRQDYPSYDGGHAGWLENATRTHTDVLFSRFLNAGAARVRVPVHLEWSYALLYFQLNEGAWWPVETEVPIPSLEPAGDPEVDLFNGFIADLNEKIDEAVLTDPDPEFDPDEPSYLVKLPTTLVWLQSVEDPLPNLEDGDA